MKSETIHWVFRQHRKQDMLKGFKTKANLLQLGDSQAEQICVFQFMNNVTIH